MPAPVDAGVSARTGAAVAALGAAVPTLLLSWPRTATTLQGVDGAEMALTAARGTLLHPPGFPTYAALLQLVVGDRGEATYAACATLSALLHAGATAVLAIALTRLSGRASVGGALALVWGVSESSLRTATDADVFALHHVVLAALILAAHHAFLAPRQRAFALLGVLAGLGGATQPIVVLAAPLVMGACMAAPGGVRGKARALAMVIAGAAVGLAPYALLPSMYAASPGLAFGRVVDLADVVDHALRRDYGTWSTSTRGGTPAALRLLVGLGPVLPAVLLAPFVAAALAWRRRVAEGAALGAALALAGLGSLAFTLVLRFPEVPTFDEVAHRFFPTVTMLGAAAAAWILANGALDERRRRWAALGALLVPAGLGLPHALDAADARQDTLLELHLRRLLAQAPPSALFFTGGDGLSFGAVYLQQVGGMRPDVVVVVPGRLGNAWAWDALRAQLPELPDLAGHRPLATLVQAAFAQGRAVVGSNEAEAPPGVVRRPAGDVWRWSERAPPDLEVTQAVLGACATLPDELARRSTARASVEHARALFLAPLDRAAAAGLGGATLPEALRHLDAGDVASARRVCAAALGSARP